MSTTRATGEPPALRFEDLVVGSQSPPSALTVSTEQVAVFHALAGTGTDDMSLVPPMLLASFRPLKDFLALPVGVLHIEDELTLHHSARVGANLVIQLSIADKFEKYDRNYVIVEQRVSDEKGEAIVSISRRISWPSSQREDLR